MFLEKQSLITEAQQFLLMLEKRNLANESLEWYLVNQLKAYLTSLSTATSTQEIRMAAEKLNMFCVESMDWDTDLFKRCSAITKNALRFSKK